MGGDLIRCGISPPLCPDPVGRENSTRALSLPLPLRDGTNKDQRAKWSQNQTFEGPNLITSEMVAKSNFGEKLQSLTRDHVTRLRQTPGVPHVTRHASS